MGLLPRGDGEQDGVYTHPNKYTQGISNVNAGLRTFASGLPGVEFVDCGPQLLPDGKVCLFYAQFSHHLAVDVHMHVQLQSLAINSNVHSCLIRQIGGGPASLQRYLCTCHHIPHQ